MQHFRRDAGKGELEALRTNEDISKWRRISQLYPITLTQVRL